MVNDQTKEILAFIKESPEGRRWTDNEKEFVTERGWSKGKFVAHWKEAKKFLEKKLDPKNPGRFRYFVKEEFTGEAEKAILSGQVDKNSLWKVKIPEDKLTNGAKKIWPLFWDTFNYQASFNEKRKLRSENNQIFIRAERDFIIELMKEQFDLSISYPPGSLQPHFYEHSIGLMMITAQMESFGRPQQEFLIHIRYTPPENPEVKFGETRDKILWKAFLELLTTKKISMDNTQKVNRLWEEFQKGYGKYLELVNSVRKPISE